MAEFVMPTLGADMTAGTLLTWMKKPGDEVKRGEIIAEVDTDKGVIEVEVFTSGIVEKLLIEPGAEVPVGTVMAVIREEHEVRREELPMVTAPSIPAEVQKPAAIIRPTPTQPRVHVSPTARKLAAELHVDLSTVKGTGPGGRIQRADVERAAPAKPVPSGVQEAAAARQERMRRTIAAAMARSKREIPHYYLSTTIDLSKAMAWLSAENLKRPVANRLLYGVLLLKAVALALHEVPELNALWKEDKLSHCLEINVGVAISLREGGLVAPALLRADQQDLDDLMKNFRDLVKRARAGSLRSSELSEPTITVTSLGERGVESVFGVIYPPQVAIVGFGRPIERPRQVDGQVALCPAINATLSADHRVTDGHRGSLFLTAVDRLLQDPGKL
ncbi:MAG TPA: dihydrolipoamide acetyltransferase family protein [Pyrinomonadaceae bacterium]|nr:dihydrolipoamide acetyltransferase family protein [Pyrinomonadaceae bacterium]